MRHLYSALFYLLIPFITFRLLWRSIKAPEYRFRWGERFGFYAERVESGVIWVHAVSVGEAEAVFPLIKKIQQRYPRAKLLLTSTTPTGSARIRAVMGDSVHHVYLPYDTPDIVNRFMSAFRPRLAVIMETEIWPNLFFYCGEHGIPLYMVNARLSAKSAEGYAKLSSLVHPVIAQVKRIAAQTQEDAERFVNIGAKPEQINLTGNIKFDLEIAGEVIGQGLALKQSAFTDRYVWIGASTHKGEEELLIEVYNSLKSRIPKLLLLIVPRHPERFGEVAELCKQQGLSFVNRTSRKSCRFETDVYLADTMGELKMLYAAADVALVGGSMVPVGGHNILEALAVGLPVLFGPYMRNFKEIASKVLADNAAVQCQDKAALVQAILQIYSDQAHRQTLIDSGRQFVQANRGAMDRVFELIRPDLDQSEII